MGAKRFWNQNFSLFIVKFKKLGFSASIRPFVLGLGFGLDLGRFKDLKNCGLQFLDQKGLKTFF